LKEFVGLFNDTTNGASAMRTYSFPHPRVSVPRRVFTTPIAAVIWHALTCLKSWSTLRCCGVRTWFSG